MLGKENIDSLETVQLICYDTVLLDPTKSLSILGCIPMHLLICDTKGDKREKAKNKTHQHGFSTPTLYPFYKLLSNEAPQSNNPINVQFTIHTNNMRWLSSDCFN
jgi:hypothetical protein